MLPHLKSAVRNFLLESANHIRVAVNRDRGRVLVVFSAFTPNSAWASPFAAAFEWQFSKPVCPFDFDPYPRHCTLTSILLIEPSAWRI